MTSVNEAIELLPSPAVYFLETGKGQTDPPPNSEGLPCDQWHLAGPRSSNLTETEMMTLIKEKLPKVDFPVRTGATGYIIWPKMSELPPAGHTLDETGRTVGIVGGIRFFQRYTRSCMLVSDMGKGGDFFTTLSDEDKKILREKLVNYE
jgi:hypothetical protein